ncbi:MAG TPA: DUF3365 domain-containing protein [Cyclobacteriaceae bacterium]|nr:DUF3365 domain-containing protein [Cyclobacteriaceae bacterium]
MKAKMFVLAWAGVAGILLTAAPGCSKRAESNDVVLHDSVYIAQGDRIVAMTFDTLRKSLQGAIAQGNFEGAIAFCREQANPVTATYADSFKIRRTALRVRNPDNRPDSLELAVLIAMGNEMQAARQPGVKVVRTSNEIHFFKPILLQAMCLNCHGTPGQQIADRTLTRIAELYPADQAVNFKEGDLRGAWHITFDPLK